MFLIFEFFFIDDVCEFATLFQRFQDIFLDFSKIINKVAERNS